jgi:hypothetical protein
MVGWPSFKTTVSQHSSMHTLFLLLMDKNFLSFKRLILLKESFTMAYNDDSYTLFYVGD